MKQPYLLTWILRIPENNQWDDEDESAEKCCPAVKYRLIITDYVCTACPHLSDGFS